MHRNDHKILESDKLKEHKESVFNAIDPQQSVLHSWQDPRVLSMYRTRKLKDSLSKILSIVSLLAILYPLLDMLYMFAYKGVQVISITRLTGITSGYVGLANEIAGTFLLIALSSAIVIPIGVSGGIYMAEFSRKSKYTEMIHFVIDILAGVPSIVLGYCGYLLLVLYFGCGFSALAGAITLSVLMLPYIVRTAELSLNKVPTSIREAATALGCTKTTMINRLTLRFALPGILTGILLAISIAFGEIAALLFTAGASDYMPTGALCNSQVGYLTYAIFQFSTFQSPISSANNLAYLAAFLLIVIVLSINVIARIGLRRLSRYNVVMDR